MSDIHAKNKKKKTVFLVPVQNADFLQHFRI